MSNVAIVLFGELGLDRAAQGVAGAAQGLKAAGAGDVTAVVVGSAADGMADGLAQLVDRVVVVSDPALEDYQPETALQALSQVLPGVGATTVLLGNDIYSQEITPRLAARLGGSSLADAMEVTVEGDSVRATRSAYGGKALAVYELKRSPAVVWVRARALEPGLPTGGQAAVDERAVQITAPGLAIVERKAEAQEGVRLEDAQVIVSGGRGLGGPEPFEVLRGLADAMGAEMGASRAACDAGWVPGSWQVGQTGKKVAPELYVAIAISGASQHLLGMGDSKVIAAVNTDGDAPIFKHCSFGIVEDYKNVVPRLTEKVAELRK
ncbi:MAG: electron transfer flavoprotein subunit alpha/FixB family protein [Acidobacteriota bacterium]|nr:electron transfer flavoprotein subunit alpha/FixB family protein [Acidobacteriota bacterium]